MSDSSPISDNSITKKITVGRGLSSDFLNVSNQDMEVVLRFYLKDFRSSGVASVTKFAFTKTDGIDVVSDGKYDPKTGYQVTVIKLSPGCTEGNIQFSADNTVDDILFTIGLTYEAEKL